MGLKVFVDAKIVGRHDKQTPRRSFVAYVVDGRPELNDVAEVKAYETDEAELQAVAFAIRKLKGEVQEFTVVCDHESIVSEINRREPLGPGKEPVLLEIRQELEINLE